MSRSRVISWQCPECEAVHYWKWFWDDALTNVLAYCRLCGEQVHLSHMRGQDFARATLVDKSPRPVKT